MPAIIVGSPDIHRPKSLVWEWSMCQLQQMKATRTILFIHHQFKWSETNETINASYFCLFDTNVKNKIKLATYWHQWRHDYVQAILVKQYQKVQKSHKCKYSEQNSSQHVEDWKLRWRKLYLKQKLWFIVSRSLS